MKGSFKVKSYFMGFTLIELMVTLVIIVILAAIAIPAYQNSAVKSRRTTAQNNLQLLLELAQQYYSNNNYAYPSISNSTYPNGEAPTSVFLNVVPNSITSSSIYNYMVKNCGGSTGCFLAQATISSTGPQANDSNCACMTLDSTGMQHAYNNTNCNGTDTTSSCWTR